MTKRSLKPKTRRHVMIYDEDWKFLDARFGTGAPPGRAVGVGAAIASIVELYCKRLAAREAQIADAAAAPQQEEEREAHENP